MGRSVIDLSGKKFGRLLVIERDLSYPSGAGKSVYWKCKCDCGNEISVRADKLKNSITQSCGCLSKEVHSQIFLKNLSGKRFGRLVVLKRDTSKPMGKECFAYWICKCDCGNEVSVRGDHLRNNTTQSCGCLNSSGEEKISSLLQAHNIPYKIQYTFSDLRGDHNLLRFDFAILNKDESLQCLIEFQGKQHFYPWGAESEERFKKRLEYDQKKRDYCQINNIPLFEIKYNDDLAWELLSNYIKEE